MHQKTKKLGIWLDFKEAIILQVSGSEILLLEEVDSNIEDFHPSGGAPSKTKFGLGEIVSEKKYLARRKQQEDAYFQNIIRKIIGENELFIFGPAEAKYGLRTKILDSKKSPSFIRKVQTTDQMTMNQKKAMVRNFYKV
nr:hypothetical protein [uncultured bacterium]